MAIMTTSAESLEQKEGDDMHAKVRDPDGLVDRIQTDDYRAEYRNAMARLGASVNIVTSDGAAGRVGFAATSVCSVSDSPPTLLVCINRTSSAYGAIRKNGVLCVNIVGSHHEHLCRLFGGKTPVEQRFAAAGWSTFATGSPHLEAALASFDCRISAIYDGRTHDILLCEVVSIKANEGGNALIYLDRKYHAI
jgi:flavin reductase